RSSRGTAKSGKRELRKFLTPCLPLFRGSSRPCLLMFHQDDHVSDGGVFRAHALGGLGFDPHAVRRNVEQLRHMSTNPVRVWPDLWCSHDQGGIHVQDLTACRRYPSELLRKQPHRIRTLPLGIGGREQRTDFGRSNSAQQSVGYRMKQDAPTRVAAQSFWVCYLNSADL